MVHALHRPLSGRKMRKPTSVDVVGVALVTALGLLGGCGGIASRSSGDDGGPSSGEGGAGTNPVPGSPTFASPSVCTAHPCVDPKPVIVANVDTGYDTCADGVLRRRAIVDCPSLLPRAATNCVYDCDAGSIPGACAKDSDCTEHPFGFCRSSGAMANTANPTDPFAPIICFSTCTCTYGGCVRDSDCGNNEICVCADPVGSCLPSSCSSGKNCQPGCDCVGAFSGFQCQTQQDTCLTAGECVDAGYCGCYPAVRGIAGAPLSCGYCVSG
jgi:hypothetical protein